MPAGPAHQEWGRRDVSSGDAWRARDRRAGINLTHALVTGFSNHLPLLPLLRGQALTAMSLLPVTRRALARVMMFGVGAGR